MRFATTRRREWTDAAWRDDEKGLYERVHGLHLEIHTGAYRAKPSRRVLIPKADGRQRPLGIASLEDKVVLAKRW